MNNITALIPLIIVGIIIFFIVIRSLNKATIKKAVESDWQKRKKLMNKRVEDRKRKSGSGTKFKSSLTSNPNAKKWDRLKAKSKLMR